MHSNDYDYAAGRAQVRPSDVKRYKEVFTRKIYETRHPLVRVHPESGERSLILGHFVKRFVDVGSADARHLFDIFQSHIVRHENTVRWRWAPGDVAMWDNRATRHRAVDDYDDQPRNRSARDLARRSTTRCRRPNQYSDHSRGLTDWAWSRRSRRCGRNLWPTGRYGVIHGCHDGRMMHWSDLAGV